MIAHANDLDNPKRMMLVNVPRSPKRITGRRPIRSDNIPHRMPKQQDC